VGASKDFAGWLRDRDRKYLALEMETAGVMNVVYQHAGDERLLAVRAISDLSDDRKSMLDDVGGGALRTLAMRSAIRLLNVLMRAGEFDRAAGMPAPPLSPVSPATPAPALAPASAPAPDAAALLTALAEHDPLVSLDAAAQLAKVEVDIDRLLAAVALRAIPTLAARRVVAAHASRAWPVMLSELESGDWGRGMKAAALCVPEFRPYLEELIAQKVDKQAGSMDDVRVWIKALGRMVATDHAFLLGDLAEKIQRDDYGFEKWEPYLIEALGQIFARCVTGPDDGFDPLQRAATIASQYEKAIRISVRVTGDQDRHYSDRFRFFGACNAVHASVALDRWLDADLELLRADAAIILGHTRLSRAVSKLIDVYARRDESDAAWALAMIGGDRALGALQARGSRRSRAMLALRADELSESWIAAELRSGTNDNRWALLRAVGLLRLSACRDSIENGLEDKIPAVRGCAALALARLEGATALRRLERIHAEATGHLDRLSYALAVLHVAPDRFASFEASLRRDLADQSFILEKPLQDDVLGVLSGVPGAERLVAVWTPLYREGGVTWHC
jgi:hypothetical protein